MVKPSSSKSERPSIWSSGTQGEEAKDDGGPNPDRHPAAIGKRADERQRQAHPAQEDRVDVAEAGQRRVERALLHQVQLFHHVAAEEGVEDRGREPTAQVGAQGHGIAPAFEIVVGGGKGEDDGRQRRRPDQQPHRAQDHQVERCLAQLLPPRASGWSSGQEHQQHDERKDAQKEGADHLGQAGEGEEETRQRRGAAPGSRRQAGIQRAQQHERIKGQPLGGHHVVVAQRGVDGPVAGKGEEGAGDEGGEVGGDG